MKYTAETIKNLLYTNALIVGRYGTGKTRSCASLRKLRSRPYVKGNKLLIFDLDEGCQPIIRLAEKYNWLNELDIRRYAPVGGSRLATAPAASSANAMRSSEMFIGLATDINYLLDRVDPTTNQWREEFLPDAPYAVLLDSLTKLADDALSFTLSLRGKELGGAGVDGRQEYGIQMGKIVETIRDLRSLPCFTVVTAHEQTKAETIKMPAPPKGGQPIDPKLTGRDWRLPVVTGQLANTIGGEFGLVLYSDTEPLTTDKLRYFWWTRPAENIFGAKTRLRDDLPIKVDQDFDIVIEGSTDPKVQLGLR